MGIEIAAALGRLYPRNFEMAKLVELLGNATTVHQLADGMEPAAVVGAWEKDLDRFDKMRSKYLLYR